MDRSEHRTPKGVPTHQQLVGYKHSLLRSEEEETIRFHLRHSPTLRDFLMESFLLTTLVENETAATWKI